MRSRINTLAKYSSQRLFGMWVGTFHSIAHRLLRAHHLDAGLLRFSNFRRRRSLRLVKRLMKSHQYDEKIILTNKPAGTLITKKKERFAPASIDDNNDREEQEWIKICKLSKMLVIVPVWLIFPNYYCEPELFLKKPLILQRYRQRFQHIRGRIQDICLQYAWIKLLAGAHGKVMIVGDDDQSIYGWRGAKVKKYPSFSTRFSQAQTIAEQNYRSTGNICKVLTN